MERRVPTYLLDDYYYSLADKLAVETELKLRDTEDIIIRFIHHMKKDNLRRLKTYPEYGLELLYIGVLYISYSKKEGASFYGRLESLHEWMAGTKEFDEIGAGFKLWLDYWLESGTVNQDFPRILGLTEAFLETGERYLYRYVKQVPEFIRNAARIYEDREDFVFITRHVNEYYINMVGAQILNRVFREEFQAADKVYLFVPGCMAARMEGCRAEAGRIGYVCRQCTVSCPIRLAGQIGARYGADTVIVYHSSELYHTKVPSEETSYGVIGVACVLNLISGGLKARELGYIPQCVLLNYCGCKQHWDLEGLVTDIDKDRLEQILNGR